MRTLVFLLAVLLPAQDQTDQAKKLLDKVGATYKDVAAIRVTMEFRGMGAKDPEVTTFTLSRPNKARIEKDGYLNILTGTDYWTYEKSTNVFFHRKQDAKDLDRCRLGAPVELYMKQGVGSLLDGATDVTLTEAKIGDDACTRIVWKVGYATHRLWITSKNVPLQYERVFAGEEGDYWEKLNYAIDTTVKPTEEMFSFKPPEGAKEKR